jgi:hypothetical protein
MKSIPTHPLRAMGLAAFIAVCAAQSPQSMAQGAATATTAPIPKGPGSLNGIWLNADYKFTGLPAGKRAVTTSDGSPPPLLPAQAAILEKRIKDADKGEVFANTLSQCLPGGTPQMLWGAAYPIQIIESPSQITMLFEEQNRFRIIFLSGTQPKDPDPSYFGYSLGHWEGDTLVVDTIGLNDRTTLDMVGTPHTEALHMTERYRRTGQNTMEVQVTLDDPGAFSKPWEAKVHWKAAAPGTRVAEYICENNRNTADANGNTGFGK